MSTVVKLRDTGVSCDSVPKGVRMEPVLQIISEFLSEHDELTDLVRNDLTRGLKNPKAGRKGLTASQALRSLILMRIKDWDLRELRERINDGMTLRQFTEFHHQRVPKHDAFNRTFNRLTPNTMKAINDRTVQVAVELDLEDGRRLRVDTTVSETDIHYPTDNTLLWDAVRVITRLVERLIGVVDLPVTGFHNRTLSARRRMQEIQRMTTRQRNVGQTKKYKELIKTSAEVVASARAVLEQTREAHGKTLLAELELDELRREIEKFCGLGDRVIEQTRRRVVEGKQVSAEEKIYSIFEPHTDMIKRGKVRKPVEFGHKVFIAESAQGLVTQYEVLDGNPRDDNHVKSSLECHQQSFGRVPEVYSADRGFFSEPNIDECKRRGVKEACIPQCGGKRTPEREAYEKSRVFKKWQRFRAGIEGRLSVLFRGRGMKRCRAHGRERFEVFVGSAVLANNLMRIADLLANRPSRKRRAA